MNKLNDINGHEFVMSEPVVGSTYFPYDDAAIVEWDLSDDPASDWWLLGLCGCVAWTAVSVPAALGAAIWWMLA